MFKIMREFSYDSIYDRKCIAMLVVRHDPFIPEMFTRRVYTYYICYEIDVPRRNMSPSPI